MADTTSAPNTPALTLNTYKDAYCFALDAVAILGAHASKVESEFALAVSLYMKRVAEDVHEVMNMGIEARQPILVELRALCVLVGQLQNAEPGEQLPFAADTSIELIVARLVSAEA